MYLDSNGDKKSICIEGKEKVVDFSEECVFSTPWEPVRMVINIDHLMKKKFIYDEDNHKGFYYEQIGMCYVNNGNHSTAVGLSKKQVDDFRFSVLFELAKRKHEIENS